MDQSERNWTQFHFKNIQLRNICLITILKSTKSQDGKLLLHIHMKFMNITKMTSKRAFLTEWQRAKVAWIWFFSSMSSNMPFDFCRTFHHLWTNWASPLLRAMFNWIDLKIIEQDFISNPSDKQNLFIVLFFQVICKMAFLSARIITKFTNKRFFSCMSPNMSFNISTAIHNFATNWTGPFLTMNSNRQFLKWQKYFVYFCLLNKFVDSFHVSFKTSICSKWEMAKSTTEWFFSCVSQYMPPNISSRPHDFRTVRTSKLITSKTNWRILKWKVGFYQSTANQTSQLR